MESHGSVPSKLPIQLALRYWAFDTVANDPKEIEKVRIVDVESPIGRILSCIFRHVSAKFIPFNRGWYLLILKITSNYGTLQISENLWSFL